VRIRRSAGVTAVVATGAPAVAATASTARRQTSVGSGYDRPAGDSTVETYLLCAT
jgi:hypothetical protein